MLQVFGQGYVPTLNITVVYIMGFFQCKGKDKGNKFVGNIKLKVIMITLSAAAMPGVFAVQCLQLCKSLYQHWYAVCLSESSTTWSKFWNPKSTRQNVTHYGKKQSAKNCH